MSIGGSALRLPSWVGVRLGPAEGEGSRVGRGVEAASAAGAIAGEGAPGTRGVEAALAAGAIAGEGAPGTRDVEALVAARPIAGEEAPWTCEVEGGGSVAFGVAGGETSSPSSSVFPVIPGNSSFSSLSGDVARMGRGIEQTRSSRGCEAAPQFLALVFWKQ